MKNFLDLTAKYPEADGFQYRLQDSNGKFFYVVLDVIQWNKMLNHHQNAEPIYA
jgi:hypothetical protein